MSLKFKRNIWIFVGLLFATFIKVTIIIPYVNILFSIFCFYRAYKINEIINRNKDSIN